MGEIKINKQEVKYILFSVGFALLWFFLAMPFLLEKFDGNSPFLQFLIFNVGLVIFFQIFLKSIVLSSRISVSTSIGLISLILAIDTFLPEYHVTFAGELIKGGVLGISTSDYIWGLLAVGIGLKGIFIFIFTYVVIPFILLLISAKLIPNFVKRL